MEGHSSGGLPILTVAVSADVAPFCSGESAVTLKVSLTKESENLLSKVMEYS